jgi:hypothetical protein
VDERVVAGDAGRAEPSWMEGEEEDAARRAWIMYISSSLNPAWESCEDHEGGRPTSPSFT